MKKAALITLFLLFWAAAFSQWAGGRREDWPFSFFGMYSKPGSLRSVWKTEIILHLNDGTEKTLTHFLGAQNDYVLAHIKNELLHISPEERRSERVKNNISDFLAKNVWSKSEKEKLQNISRVEVQFNYWEKLNPASLKSPELLNTITVIPFFHGVATKPR